MDMQIDKRLIDLFLDLVRIDGPSGREGKVAAFVKSFCARLNLSVREDDAHRHSGGDSGNLICRIGPGGDFALVSHMDTAASTADLKPVISRDRVTSDGTTILGADNRAGIAAILYSVEKLAGAGAALGDFTIVFTIDEERDLVGSKRLQLDPNIKMAFAFDSHFRPGHFIYRTYGSKHFTVKIQGEAAHASTPEKGISSIHIASLALAGIALGKVDDETTANVGIISGGTATNTVPGETMLKGEVRSAHPARVDSLIGKIERRFAETAERSGGASHFKSEWVFQPFLLSPDAEVYKRIEAAIEAVGLEPRAMMTAGGSDANNLNAKGIQSVNVGIGAQNAHSTDEFILLEDLQKTAEIVQNLIKMGKNN